MKKTIRIFCALLTVALIACLAPMAVGAEEGRTVTDAEGQTRTNLASVATANSTKLIGTLYSIYTDGDRGDNSDTKNDVSTSFCSGSKVTDNQCAFSHRGASTASVTVPSEDYKNQEICDKSYWYYIDIMLDAPSTVDGFCFYLKGYKEAVMDHGFDIYYSTDDGDTWTLIVGTENPFDTNSDIHYANWDATTPFEGNTYNSGKDNSTTIESPAYIFYNIAEPIANVTDIAYACSATRCNNGHYMARFTEFEVYGTASEGTDDPGSTDTTVPGGNTDTTVPGGTTDTTVPGGTTDTTVPGGNTDTTVPGSDVNTTVPGGDSNTTVPGGNTDNTTVPGGDENTTVPGGNDTTKADDKKDSSCKSTFACGIALVAVFGSAVVLGKKH